MALRPFAVHTYFSRNSMAKSSFDLKRLINAVRTPTNGRPGLPSEAWQRCQSKINAAFAKITPDPGSIYHGRENTAGHLLLHHTLREPFGRTPSLMS